MILLTFALMNIQKTCHIPQTYQFQGTSKKAFLLRNVKFTKTKSPKFLRTDKKIQVTTRKPANPQHS
jgi:hypothetical protein